MAIITNTSNRDNFSATLACLRMRLTTLSRYKGQIFMDLLIPLVIASMPILLGRYSGGDQAAEIFNANTGTTNYVGFMLVGSSAFSIVSYAFWHIAYWLRWEMETGTIESIYLTPTRSIWIAGGVAIYSMSHSIINGVLAYFIGSWIFGSNPFQGELLLALVFVLVGMLPLYGVALIFGAIILKLKQANSIVNLVQWMANFLMGVFFPIAVLPPLAKFFSLIFPPTWMTNGVRSALFGVGYFFGEWYLDLAMLAFFTIIGPMAGYWIFSRVEINIKNNEGVGKF